MNGIGKLDLGSLADAALMAIVFAVLSALVGLVQGDHFDVFSADWFGIGKNMINVGFATGILSLGQSLLSTNSGSVLGVTPANSVN